MQTLPSGGYTITFTPPSNTVSHTLTYYFEICALVDGLSTPERCVFVAVRPEEAGDLCDAATIVPPVPASTSDCMDIYLWTEQAMPFAPATISPNTCPAAAIEYDIVMTSGTDFGYPAHRISESGDSVVSLFLFAQQAGQEQKARITAQSAGLAGVQSTEFCYNVLN